MNRVHEVRTKTRKTQAQISSLTGLAQPYISYIERGFWNPTDEEKIKIANALGVEVGWLFPNEKAK